MLEKSDITVRRKIIFALALTTIISLTISGLVDYIDGMNWIDWINGVTQNFGTEIMGALITFYLFEEIFMKEKERSSKFNKLIKDLKADNNTVNSTFEELQSEGWLKDGSLNELIISGGRWEDIYLVGAKIKHARLYGMNFDNAHLIHSDFSYSHFNSSSFIGAKLISSQFVSTSLAHTKMQFCNFTDANLQGAELWSANLTGAKLWGTQLKGALLHDATLTDVEWVRQHPLTEPAILPNGEKWTPETDVNKFTQESHPEYEKTLSEIAKIREQMGLPPYGN